MSDWSPYFEKLKGEVCECGRAKMVHSSFCKMCYYSLPPGTRHTLYRRIGTGYEEAYDHAVVVLKLKGRIREVPDGG